MRNVRYPNITLLLGSVALTAILVWLGVFREIFEGINSLGYLGAFISGMLLPITVTAPLATVSFFYLGNVANPFFVAIIGGMGSLVADLLILSFLKGGIFDELEEIWAEHERKNHNNGSLLHKARHEALVRLFKTKPFHFISLFTAGILILSPFPDELGIAILAYYKLSPSKLAPLSFVLNGIGIWLIVGAGSIILS